MFVLSLGLSACFHSKVDACLSEPSYTCLIDQAVTAADEAENKNQRAWALAYAVRIMAAAGDREAANSHLAVLTELVDSIPVSDLNRRMLALVVRANAMLDELDRAKTYAAKINDPYGAGLAHAWLAENRFRLGDRTGGRRSVDRALSLASELDAGERSAVLSRIAVAEAAAGDRGRTLEMAEAAREIATSQGSLARRVAALATGAKALWDAGYRRESRDYLQAASQALEALEREPGDSRYLGSALSFLALAQAETGETATARLTLDRLIEWIPKDTHPVRTSMLLGAAALVLVHIGQ